MLGRLQADSRSARSRSAIVLAALAATLVLLTAERAQGFIYWDNFGAGTIGRANLDGTGVNQAFMPGPFDGSNGVAVTATHIYWADNATDSIGRANLDGSAPDPDFITGALNAADVAVDDSHVFWAEDDTIGRATLAGGGVNHSFISVPGFPNGVAVGPSDIFWSVATTEDIGHADYDGVNPSNVEQDFIGTAFLPRGLAVNGSHVFWANPGFSTVGRASLDGTGLNNSFVSGLVSVIDVAVNPTHLFWAINDNPGTIGRANLDGSNPDNAFITGTTNTFGLTVDAGVPSPPSTAPSNAFSFGKLKRNKKKGIAFLFVNLPGPGDLSLAGKGLKPIPATNAAKSVSVAGGQAKLAIRPGKGKAARKLAKALREKGKAKVKARVTFVPTGGSAGTQVRKLKLIKRR